jgi:hypothetical protein
MASWTRRVDVVGDRAHQLTTTGEPPNAWLEGDSMISARNLAPGLPMSMLATVPADEVRAALPSELRTIVPTWASTVLVERIREDGSDLEARVQGTTTITLQVRHYLAHAGLFLG